MSSDTSHQAGMRAGVCVYSYYTPLGRRMKQFSDGSWGYDNQMWNFTSSLIFAEMLQSLD